MRPPPRARLTKEEKEERVRNGCCVYCGESGHMMKGCMKYYFKRNTHPEERQRRLDERLCLFCGDGGHRQKDCGLVAEFLQAGKIVEEHSAEEQAEEPVSNAAEQLSTTPADTSVQDTQPTTHGASGSWLARGNTTGRR